MVQLKPLLKLSGVTGKSQDEGEPIWQQNVEEKVKKSINMSPLLVRKAEEIMCGVMLHFTQQLSKCLQRPQKMPALCKVLFCYFSMCLQGYIQ